MTSKTTVAPLTLMYQKTFGEHYRAVWERREYDIISHIHVIIYVLSWDGGAVLQLIWHFQKFNQKSPQRIERGESGEWVRQTETLRIKLTKHNDIRFYIKLLVLLMRLATLPTNWLTPMSWKFYFWTTILSSGLEMPCVPQCFTVAMWHLENVIFGDRDSHNCWGNNYTICPSLS